MVKVDVISGFLGAGKTTLIKKLLAGELKNEKVVLIENEFGDVGIDGTFLQEAGIEIKEINSGCICCSLVGDFREALKKVVEDYDPDRMIIEPSGVGKLSDVEEAIEDVNLDVNALVCVVDVNKAKMYHKNFKEFFDNQIESAKLVILSRSQNASGEKIEEVVHLIHELNPHAKCIITPWEELSDHQILEVMNEKHEHHHEHDEECCCGHHHDHDEECEHDHEHDEDCCCGHHHEHDDECECGHHHHHHHGHHADEEFVSVAYDTAHTYTYDELKGMLEKLDEHILRAKGMVKSDNGWLFFDYVPNEIDIREGQVQTIGKIVVIGSEVNEDKIKEIFKVI
ncbi:MAG: CobW family GTP-binding protein [Traorella sp.]